jgi:GNAT superfamily N-acetyltransferase
VEDIYVRDALESERDAIQALTLNAYSQYSRMMPSHGWAALQQALEGALNTTAPVERIVSEQHGKLVGSVLLFPPSVDAYNGVVDEVIWPEVRSLAVVPEARGQGVATALINECVRRARQAGAVALGLHTSEVMQIAMRMYESMGFEHVPEYDFQAPGGELVKAYRRKLDADE